MIGLCLAAAEFLSHRPFAGSREEESEDASEKSHGEGDSTETGSSSSSSNGGAGRSTAVDTVEENEGTE